MRKSYRLKRLVGLITLPKTADDLVYEEQRFMRHADTAERRRKAGEYRDLMGDLGEMSDIAPLTPTTQDKKAPVVEHGTHDSNDHTME